jgi:hypothetical protein
MHPADFREITAAAAGAEKAALLWAKPPLVKRALP